MDVPDDRQRTGGAGRPDNPPEDLRERDSLTVELVLHDLNQAARFADPLIVMHAGQVVADGTPDEVITAERLAAVFEVLADVITDPTSSRPVCLWSGALLRGSAERSQLG